MQDRSLRLLRGHFNRCAVQLISDYVYLRDAVKDEDLASTKTTRRRRTEDSVQYLWREAVVGDGVVRVCVQCRTGQCGLN